MAKAERNNEINEQKSQHQNINGTRTCSIRESLKGDQQKIFWRRIDWFVFFCLRYFLGLRRSGQQHFPLSLPGCILVVTGVHSRFCIACFTRCFLILSCGWHHLPEKSWTAQFAKYRQILFPRKRSPSVDIHKQNACYHRELTLRWLRSH